MTNIFKSSSTLDEPSETAVLSGGILLETVVSQPPPALSFTDSFDPETTDGVVSESETAVPTTTSEEKLLVDTSVPPVLPGLASSDAAESSSISETVSAGCFFGEIISNFLGFDSFT